MPIRTKKETYLSKNVAGLNKLAGDIPKGSSKSFVKSADRVFEAAEESLRSGDEEKAYVMYMKYFNIYSLVKKSPEYKKDQAFYNGMFGKKKCIEAIEKAEKLSSSLNDRYEEAEATQVAIKLAKNEQKQAEELMIKVQAEEKALQQLESGPIVENEKIILSVHELYSLISKVGLDVSKLLMIDVRPVPEYTDSRVAYKHCMNIPREVLVPGVTVRHIELAMAPSAKSIWDQRSAAEHIILIDWAADVSSLQSHSTIKNLKDALYKWDPTVNLLNEPVILDGGYKDWVFYYPTLCTNPHVSTMNSAKPSPANNAIPSLDDIDYDVDLDFLKDESSDAHVTSLNEINMPIVPDRNTKPNVSDYSFTDLDKHIKFEEKSSNVLSLPKKSSVVIPDVDNSNEQDVHMHAENIQPKLPSRSLKPVTKTDVILSEQEAHNKEKGLEVFRSETAKLRAEHAARRVQLEDDANQLERLDLRKKKELKETADILRKKKHIQEELQDLEKLWAKRNQEEDSRSEEVKILQQETASKQAQLRLQENEVPDMIIGSPIKSFSGNSSPRQSPVKQVSPQHTIDTDNLDQEKRALQDLAKVQLEQKNKAILEQKRIDQEKERERMVIENNKENIKKTLERAELNQEKNDNYGNMKTEIVAKGQEKKDIEKRKLEKIDSDIREQKMQEHTKKITTSGLPDGWQRRLDGTTGRYYYIDHNTKTTHAQLPEQYSKLKPPQKVDTTYKIQLNDGGAKPLGGGGGLKRSHSSPNIAKMVQDEESVDIGSPTRLPAAKLHIPSVDRAMKPSTPSQLPARSELSAAKVRNLQPTWGTVKARGLTGLRNLGNTCYMNSVVQCMSNTSFLATYFLRDAYSGDINSNNFLGSGGIIAEEFSAVLKALWLGQYRSISPREFKASIANHNHQFDGFQQQDSQEFLLTLMDGLHEDLNKVRSRPQLPEQNNDGISDTDAAGRAWASHKKLNDSIIVELFQGQFKSTVRCLRCNKTSVTFDAFMYLSLPIPSGNRCSLEDCLRHFAREEKMTGESQWLCPNCNCKRDASKVIAIWKLPRILIIHLKRFHYRGMWREKISTNVDFPLDDLNLNHHINGPKCGAYNLYAVSNHYGTIDGGHYTAYGKNPSIKSWSKYDDHEVNDISKSDIRSSAAYILFYTSIQQGITF